MLSRRTFVAAIATTACARPESPQADSAYQWTQLTRDAGFPASYNFPVHVLADGRFVALHPQGAWQSRDGAMWTQTPLPPSGLNSAYLGYAQHEGAAWALGLLRGNYLDFSVDPLIQRTADYAHWQSLGRATTLPQVVFYGLASFRSALWMLGGFDGTRHLADIWRSSDGVTWERVATAPWSPRTGAEAIVFRERLYLIGGGVIDGPQANDVWSSGDGVTWRRETRSIAPEEPFGFTPVIFDDRIWLVGANRSGRFESGMLVSDDGAAWRAQAAPWSARGGVAAWAHGGAMFITGGKASFTHGGEIEFVYSNDVWAMRQRAT